MSGATDAHLHGRWLHAHPHMSAHRHLRFALRKSTPAHHDHLQGHGHSHGLVDRSIVRSRAGVRAVALSLGILGLTAFAQLAIFAVTSSVALFADLVHNFGDALTAVPLGIAFYLRSFRVEKIAGLAVVLAIFVSACIALYETIQRFVHPQDLTHLWVLAGAGVIGFIGNELPREFAFALDGDSRARLLSPTATTRERMASCRSAWSRAPRLSQSGCPAPTLWSAC